MDKAQPITEPEEEIYIDPNMKIGMTEYRYSELPQWIKNNIKQELIQQKINNERKYT
tara:strand:+ start:662 stop:832 length:171 start_codon:yes stop_codon:yes gene_type:complete